MLRSAALFRQNRYTSQFKKGQLPLQVLVQGFMGTGRSATQMSLYWDD